MPREPVQCWRCLFWDTSTQAGAAEPDTTGRCTLHAPTAVDDRTGRAMWPITDQEDRCFEGEDDAAKKAAETPADDELPF